MEQTLASILALDVTSYTRHMANDGPAAIATITEFHAVFRGHIESNGEHVVDLAGGSVLGVFGNASGTSRTAVYVQAAFAGRNVEFPNSRRMHLLVDVNLGNIHEHAASAVYGDGVNMAVCLEDLARPGRLMISELGYQQVRQNPDMAFAGASRHNVKNIINSIHTY